MSEPSPSSPVQPARRRPSRVVRARQGLAAALLVVSALVLFFWWQDRSSGGPAGRVSPVGLTIRQSAHGFTLSRSVGGHPVFMVHADQAIQLKQGSQARLMNVQIDLYNRDGKRANQIYGQEFGYDPASGMVTAQGKVHIDLGGIPGQPNAAAAEEAGHPIHIETNDLVFNIRTGTGQVRKGLVFRYLGAQGKADGAQLATHPDVLTLTGHVQLQWSRSDGPPVELSGQSARLDQQASLVQVDGAATILSGPQQVTADHLRFLLRRDYSIREAIAVGHVQGAQSEPQRQVRALADQANAIFREAPGPGRHAAHNPGQGMQLVTMRLNGHARMEETAPQQKNELTAGVITMLFGNRGDLSKVEARQDSRLQLSSSQPSRRATAGGREGLPLAGGPGTRSISAAGLDFLFAASGASRTARLLRLQTVGRGRMESSEANNSWIQAEADQLGVGFDPAQHPSRAEASGTVVLKQQPAPVNGKPAPLRTSTSDRLQLVFVRGQSRLQQARQDGHVELQEAGRRVLADALQYDPLSGVAHLTAQPASGFTHGMVSGEDATLRFRAPRVQLNQSSGQVQGWGGVQVSFLSGAEAVASGGSAAAAGPMFRSGVPVDVTADRMDVDEKGGHGTFYGHVRLWQGPNLTLADTMTFNRSSGVVEAIGHVISTFVQASEKAGTPSGGLLSGLGSQTAKPAGGRLGAGRGPTPVSIQAQRLHYSDAQRRGQYQGGVVLTSSQARLTAKELRIYLQPSNRAAKSAAALERVVAAGGVKITQPGRQATAETVEYDMARNLITMRGGPPSIYDAEHGYLTGQILTFSPSNDTIRVESQPGTRTFGEYRVRH